MLILAVTTSLTKASAAIFDTEADTFFKKQCADKKTYSETLMPTVSQLFDEHEISPADIDLVAVDIGPGSFTGVRIGAASMNAFCAALEKKIIGIPSLEALASPYFDESTNIVSLLDCRNGNGYAAIYSCGKEVMPPSAVLIDEFLNSVPENSLFIGDGSRLHRDKIIAKIPSARFAECEQISASSLAALAFSKFKSGEAQNEVFPLYLRPSQAERLYGKQ